MTTPVSRPLSRQQYIAYYQRFKKLSQRPEAKISGLVSLTIFTVAFFSIFAILPTLNTIASLNRQIGDAELVNTKLAQKITALNRVEEDYVGLTENLPLVEAVLPSEPEFDRLAWQLNWLVSNLGLTLNGGSFGEFFITPIKPDESVTTLPIELSISGSYTQIKALIDQIGKLDRLISVDEMALSSKKASLNNLNLTATMKLTAYFLTETP